MVKLCESYDQHREMLRDYLKGRDPLPYGRPLEPIYAAASTADPASVRLAEQMAEDVLAHVHDRLLPAANAMRERRLINISRPHLSGLNMIRVPSLS